VKALGITQRDLPPNEFGEVRCGLDVRWFEFLAACGAVAVPLPSDAELAVRTVAHLGLDGIVLSGGDSLARYGGAAAHRDLAESELLRWAIAQDVPVLGVCRGMQVVLHAFGTRLAYVAGHVAVRHEVADGAGGHREVNSYHRLGARSVADPLIATAMCGDVVEQVCHLDARVAGIMWHPEREDPFASADVKLVHDLLGSWR
jgi:N5-(cytidine 5'-diphosphoramidyl)-L-glutamine hydrolase